MDEQRYRAWLIAQRLDPRTVTNQLSRVRRLEFAFGDLDQAYAEDAMNGLLAQLDYGRHDADAGRAPPNGIETYGDSAKTMATLRHAARKYRDYLQAPVLTAGIQNLDRVKPLRPPPPAPQRKLQPTGYWAFQANPRRWDIDRWLTDEEDELVYLVSKDDGGLMQAGDLAVLRRNATPGRPACVVALLEVIEPPRIRPEPDPRFFSDPSEGAPTLRANLAVLAQLGQPLPVAELSAASQRLRARLQRSTVAIEAESFDEIVRRAGVTPTEIAARRAARSKGGAADLEHQARTLDPKRREVISKAIERGPIGRQVKAARRHRCQACEGLGLQPVAFLKVGGEPYAEAHHVIPVHQLRPGTLAAINIMVLCPNHHRQAHYGAFEILSDEADAWRVRIDRREVRIAKTTL